MVPIPRTHAHYFEDKKWRRTQGSDNMGHFEIGSADWNLYTRLEPRVKRTSIYQVANNYGNSGSRLKRLLSIP